MDWPQPKAHDPSRATSRRAEAPQHPQAPSVREVSKDFDFVAAVTGEPSADETSLSGDNATLLSAMHAFQRGYASMGIGGRRVGRTADGLKAVLTEFRVLPSQMQAEGSTQRAVTKDMVRDALHMCPTDLSSPKRWQWIADRLNKGLNT